MFLKFAIGAILAAIASLIVALRRYHSVEAALPAVIGDIGMLNAGFLFAFGPAIARFHLIIFWELPLPIQVDVLFDWSKVFETFSEIVEPDLVVFEHSYHLND